MRKTKPAVVQSFLDTLDRLARDMLHEMGPLWDQAPDPLRDKKLLDTGREYINSTGLQAAATYAASSGIYRKFEQLASEELHALSDSESTSWPAVQDSFRQRRAELARAAAADPNNAHELEAEPPQAVARGTDLDNARRFAAAFKHKLRYCETWGKWLIWDGQRWAVDQTSEVRRMARRIVTNLYQDAADAALRSSEVSAAIGKVAVSLENGKRLATMIDWAKSELTIPISPEQLDRSSWLFNCANGTIDLQTGQLKPPDKLDMITKRCPVDFDPDAECPRWCQFLGEIFAGDGELVEYAQRLAGYALTGEVSEQILVVLWGSGSNGKSTFIEVLAAMLGEDFFHKAGRSLLIAVNGDKHPEGQAALSGKRLVVATESQDADRLDEALVKELTGGDTVTARRMKENEWSFKPTHKLWLCTNHKPAVRGGDHAIWRRIKLLPFGVKFEGRSIDKGLKSKLLGELPGILAWAVRGALDWQRHGLVEPKIGP